MTTATTISTTSTKTIVGRRTIMRPHNAAAAASSAPSCHSRVVLLSVVALLALITVNVNTVQLFVAADQAEEEDGLFEPCLVCVEEGWVPLDPDVIVQQSTCQQLYEDGLAGNINPSTCPVLQAIADPDCRCSPPDFVCNVCGTADEDVKATDVEFQIPTLSTVAGGSGGSTVSCGEIQRQGLAGLISPSECDQIPVFARSPCQCAPTEFACSICGEGTGDDGGVQIISNPNFDIPPNTIFGLTSSVTCQELEDLALSGQLTPQQCTNAELTVQSYCGCAPLDFTCNICGPDPTQVVTAPDEFALFPNAANPQFTCRELEEIGNTPNGLTPDLCIGIQNIAVLPCQCGDEGDVPVVDVDNNNGDGDDDDDDEEEEEFVPCNICGQDGYTVAIKDLSVSIPAGLGTNVAAETVVCGDLEQQAFLGQISATNCEAWVPFVFTQCVCFRDPNFVPPTLSPTTSSPTASPTTALPTPSPTTTETDTTTTDAPVTAPTDEPVPSPTDAPVSPPTDAPTEDEDPVPPAPTAAPTEIPASDNGNDSPVDEDTETNTETTDDNDEEDTETNTETDAPVSAPVVPPTPAAENGSAPEPTLVPMELPPTPVPEEELPTDPPISGTTSRFCSTFVLSSSILMVLMPLLLLSM